MWKLEELEKFLEREKLNQVTAEQLDYCRFICHLLSDVYDVELRNDTFQTGKKVNPVFEIKEGELCLISTKKYPSPEEFASSVADKPPALKTNMERAYQRGEKCYYDNPANKAFVSILKLNGYLHTRVQYVKDSVKDGAALKPIKHSELKEIFGNILHRYLETNFPKRDASAKKLVLKDASFVHFASKESLNDKAYCLELLTINPKINIAYFGPDVRSSWEFVNMLMNSKIEFVVDELNLPLEMKKVILYGKHHQNPDMLFCLIQHFALKELLVSSLPPTLPFEL